MEVNQGSPSSWESMGGLGEKWGREWGVTSLGSPSILSVVDSSSSGLLTQFYYYVLMMNKVDFLLSSALPFSFPSLSLPYSFPPVLLFFFSSFHPIFSPLWPASSFPYCFFSEQTLVLDAVCCWPEMKKIHFCLQEHTEWRRAGRGLGPFGRLIFDLRASLQGHNKEKNF